VYHTMYINTLNNINRCQNNWKIISKSLFCLCQVFFRSIKIISLCW